MLNTMMENESKYHDLRKKDGNISEISAFVYHHIIYITKLLIKIFITKFFDQINLV